jgi:DNA repair exonuclease SbcCD ATPase subunit
LLAKLESALLHAEILPEADGRLEVLEGEPGGWVELRSQQRVRISGSPRVELRIPGIGRLSLTGPAESAAQLRDRLEETDRESARLTESCGGVSLEELRERRLKADALALELDRWRNLQAAHEGGASPEAVACDAARKNVERARNLLEETEKELQALEDERRRLAGEARTDAEIRQEMERLAMAAHGLEGSIRALQEQLSAFPPDLDQRFERAHRSMDTLDERLETARRQLQEARDRLNQLQGREVYTALAEKEALLEQKKNELARERLRAGANRLLKQTLDAVLDDMQRSVLPKVEQRASEILEQITDGFATRVRLASAEWRPHRLQPAVAKEEVPPDHVSGGEQEQVHLAVRLALADILTEKEPFPVVLDDALLSTDDDRLRCVLEMIRQRARCIQWMILTCHPERFHGLTDAYRIRLGGRSAAR